MPVVFDPDTNSWVDSEHREDAPSAPGASMGDTRVARQRTPQTPAPTAEQRAAAAANGQKYVKNSLGVWGLVAMDAGELLTAQQQASLTNGSGVEVQETPLPETVQQPSVAAQFTPTSVDYSRYDDAARRYETSIQGFEAELERLSGSDPFGNQAFLRKATDRAMGQAAGLASGGLSTATARAGNMRQAQGVQASLAARGIEEQAIRRNADENQAATLRNTARTGIADITKDAAGNAVELTRLQTETVANNAQQYLDAYKFDRQLSQQEVESMRQMAVAFGQIDMQRYQTDVGYRIATERNILDKYISDETLKVKLKEISAGENFSLADLARGMLGAATAVAGGVATSAATAAFAPQPDPNPMGPYGSDRRFKFDVRDPDLRDLEDFLGRTKGKLYHYKEPTKPGRRAGLNYGPMAQDLAKSKIGATVVVRGKDGLYVDTGRLALADHAALAALAAEVKALKSGK